MKKLFLIFSICLLFPFTSLAQASESQLSVSPVLLNITLSPGKTYIYTITIKNLQNVPVPLRASLDSLSTDDDGEFDFIALKRSPLVDWTSVSPQELLIPAKGTQEVTVTVKIPNQVQLGGYYAFLFLDPVFTQKKTASTVTARIGIPLLANIGVIDTAQNNTQIESFSFTKRILDTANLSTKMRITNSGLHHYSVKPVLIVKPVFGESIELPYEEKVLFPGKGRRWEVSHALTDLVPGYYKTSMRVSTGNGNQIFYEDFFIVFPYTLVFASILFITIVLFVVIRRKRIVQAIKILLKKDQ